MWIREVPNVYEPFVNESLIFMIDLFLEVFSMFLVFVAFYGLIDLKKKQKRYKQKLKD